MIYSCEAYAVILNNINFDLHKSLRMFSRSKHCDYQLFNQMKHETSSETFNGGRHKSSPLFRNIPCHQGLVNC